MFKAFLGFFVIGLTSVGLFAANFDDVVWNDEVVEEKVEAGFGITFLLEVIASKEVSSLYQELSKLGRVSIFAQKLPPQNANETKTTRLTFEAWQKTSFLEREKVKTLVVDCFSNTNIMDDAPTYYRIVTNN
jgi:hypothetical protein